MKENLIKTGNCRFIGSYDYWGLPILIGDNTGISMCVYVYIYIYIYTFR